MPFIMPDIMGDDGDGDGGNGDRWSIAGIGRPPVLSCKMITTRNEHSVSRQSYQASALHFTTEGLHRARWADVRGNISQATEPDINLLVRACGLVRNRKQEKLQRQPERRKYKQVCFFQYHRKKRLATPSQPRSGRRARQPQRGVGASGRQDSGSR